MAATGSTLWTAPIPCPEPQISFQALGAALVPKFIFEGSLSGNLSGSIPARTIDDFR
jgi:hypothetical protein